MNEHPISELLRISMDSIKDLASCNIILGDEVRLGEASILPISRVRCTFLSGGLDQKKKSSGDEFPFGGASGGNVSIMPVGFLAYINGEVKFMITEENTHVLEKMIDLIYPVFEKLTSMVSKNTKHSQIDE